MKKEIPVTIQEPLDLSQVSIGIATLGWKTVYYKVYDKGTPYPDAIPNSSNLYVVRISYKNSITSSQVYIHSNQATGCDFNFDLSKHMNVIHCVIFSRSYPELNKTVQLTDVDTDTAKLIKELRQRMKE